MYLPERAFAFTITAHEMIAFPRMRDLLLEHGVGSVEELDQVQLYITSRIDNDDAAHVDAVKATQQEACGAVNSELENRLIITYLDHKLFWLPDAQKPLGQLATVPTEGHDEEFVKKEKRAMRFRPVLQSLAVDKTLMFCHNPINCYSHYHYQPAYIIYSRNETDCNFIYEWNNTVRVLNPGGKGSVGGLYSRTPGSWYAELNNRGYKYLNMNLDVFTGCGIDPGELSATNLLLGVLYHEAKEAASLKFSGGFGGIGVLSTWRKTQERMYKEDAEYRAGMDSLAGNLELQFRYKVLVRTHLFGNRWVLGHVMNYTALAEEVLRNASVARAEVLQPHFAAQPDDELVVELDDGGDGEEEVEEQ